MEFLVRHVACCLLLSAAMSCSRGPTIDLGLAEVPSDSPRILSLRFIGQSTKSSEVMVFEIDYDFFESEAALGLIHIFINGVSTSKNGSDLKPILLQNELDPKSRKGTLRIPVQVYFAGENQSTRKTEFEIGFQLTNARGQNGNFAKARFFAELEDRN